MDTEMNGYTGVYEGTSIFVVSEKEYSEMSEESNALIIGIADPSGTLKRIAKMEAIVVDDEIRAISFLHPDGRWIHGLRFDTNGKYVSPAQTLVNIYLDMKKWIEENVGNVKE